MNEMTSYYGKDEPSATYKWGVIIRPADPRARWEAIAWFKTRKRAEEYARSGWAFYAIARAQGL